MQEGGLGGANKEIKIKIKIRMYTSHLTCFLGALTLALILTLQVV